MATKYRNLDAMNGMLGAYARALCRKAGITVADTLSETVQRLRHQRCTSVEAWLWIANRYEEDNCEALLDNKGQRKMLNAFRNGVIRYVRKQEAEGQGRVEALGKRFYATRRWKMLRYHVLQSRGARCEVCGRTPSRHGVIVHVDHIKPRSKYPALALEESNLQIMCEDCNMGKGAQDEIDWRATQDVDESAA